MSTFSEQWREVCAYDYHTPEGLTAFSHIRLESRVTAGEKRFNYAVVLPHPLKPPPPRWQRARAANGHTGWALGTLSALDPRWRHVPFRLHWVKKWAARGDSNPQPLWVVEGEKDALALHGLGLRATTAHGAAGGWTQAETQWLLDVGWRGPVNVVVDDDDSGYIHGFKTVAALGGFIEGWGPGAAGVFRAAKGNDAHDAIVTAGLGVNDWAVPVPLSELLDLAEAAQKATNGGGSGDGTWQGYRQARMQADIDRGDW